MGNVNVLLNQWSAWYLLHLLPLIILQFFCTYRQFFPLGPVVFGGQAKASQSNEARKRRNNFEEGIAVGQLRVWKVVEGQVGCHPLEAGQDYVGREAVRLLFQAVHDCGSSGLGVGAVNHEEKCQAQAQLS